MKNIDMLAKACEPVNPAPATATPDMSKMTSDVVDAIARRVIEIMSAEPAEPSAADPEPEPTQQPEGGAVDESGHDESGQVD
jgi:hypothetical protein